MHPAEGSCILYPSAGLFSALGALVLGAAILFSGGQLAASNGEPAADEAEFAAGEAEDDAFTNPFLGDPEAIEEGYWLFLARCTGCHWNPLRGPRIFQTKRSYEYFLEVVINGRKTLRTMPPFGSLLSPDDISKIHAFLMSRGGLRD